MDMKSVSVWKEQTYIQQTQLNVSRVGQPSQDTAQKEKKDFEQQRECISSQPVPLIDVMWPIYNERVERGSEFIVKGE